MRTTISGHRSKACSVTAALRKFNDNRYCADSALRSPCGFASTPRKLRSRTARPTLGTMSDMKLFTIGYSKKSAEEFFDILRDNGVKRVVDIRQHNTNPARRLHKER